MIRFLLLIVIIISSGCREKTETLAKVGKDKVTLSEFQEKMSDGRFSEQAYLKTLPGRKEFLELLIRQKIVLAEAEKKFAQPSPDLKKKWDTLENQYQEQLQQLKAQKNESRRQMMVEEFLRYLKENDLKVTDDQVRQMWEKEKEFKASHILLSDEIKAKEILDQLSKGKSFGDLAKKYSEDVETAKNHGDLGFLKKGTLVPEFENALFSLKTGEVSEIVSSPFGFHIIRKTGEKKLSDKPYDKMAPLLRGILEKRQFHAWLENHRKNYNVSTNLAALQSLSVSPEPALPSKTSKK